MFWAISNCLFKNAQANLLITLALIFPHIGLPGFQIIEFSLLNRTFVLPFLLGSIYLYLKNKRRLAFFLLGMMLNFHVIYASFVLCMFMLNELANLSKKTWWNPLLKLGVFFCSGLPVIIWRLQTGNGIDFTLNPELLKIATDGLLYTVYYPIGTSSTSIFNLAAGLGTVWAFIIGYRLAPKNELHQTVLNFTLAIGILVIISMIVSYVLPVTILLQLQILRAAVFMLYFGMLYFSYFFCQEESENQLSDSEFNILALSFILIITPLFTILFYYLAKKLNKYKFNPKWWFLVVCLVQAVVVFIAFQSGYIAPGFHLYGPNSSWRDVQEWAKKYTSIDSKFISPPHLFWHYTPDWRVFSERASVATIPEMMEIPFDPSYSKEFQRRFEAVAPGAIELFNGDYVQSLETTKFAYYSNSASDFINTACEFSADYLVVEQPHTYDLELVFENSGFLIYKIPACP